MRIWDLPARCLCRRHLLGEHRELHGLWNILTRHKGKGGYSRHPETLRWAGRLAALYKRHEAQAAELARRGYKHHSPLNERLAVGSSRQTARLQSLSVQKSLLKKKGCGCPLSPRPRR